MTQDYIIHLAREAMVVAMMLAGPPLIFGLVVGLAVSILQATTQIQEQTLTFGTKDHCCFYRHTSFWFRDAG